MLNPFETEMPRRDLVGWGFSLIAVRLFDLKLESPARTRTSETTLSDEMSTPRMGFNLWPKIAAEINADIFRANFRFIKNNGWDKLGYLYGVIDDGWQAWNRENGHLYPDPDKFPSDSGTDNGVAKLGDEMKKKGMLLGLYTDVGDFTCTGRPGTPKEKVKQDLLKMSEWGVRFIKVDWCGNDGRDANDQYGDFNDNIPQTGDGTPIEFSICNWALDVAEIRRLLPRMTYQPKMWRIGKDVFARFPLGDPNGEIDGDPWQNMLSTLDTSTKLRNLAGRGKFNDMEILLAGIEVLTHAEEQSQFGLWAINGSPLFIGTYLPETKQSSLDILSNPEVIAVNQDLREFQARKFPDSQNGSEAYIKYLSSGSNDYVVLLFNRTEKTSKISINLGPQKVSVRNLYEQKDVGKYSGAFSQDIEPHGSMMFKIAA